MAHAPPSALRLLPCAALLVGACSGPPAATAPARPAPPAQPVQPSEPIAEYVVAAFTDSKGVLWFGTIGNGVARYDGEALTYFNPAGDVVKNTVVSIAEDARGNLWFAGHAGTGLSRYDGTTFTQLWTDETRVRADRKGDIWASTDLGVFHGGVDGLHAFPVPLADRATAYTIVPGRLAMELEDSRGDLWFRTDGHGTIKYDGRSFVNLTKKDGLCSDTVWNIVEDQQGHMWFSCVQAFQPHATGDGGLRRYDGTSFTAFPNIPGLTATDIYTLYLDRSGALWIGAMGVGVIRHADGVFTTIKTTDRPDLNGRFGLQAMTQDRHGALWYGFSGGLFRLDGERLVHVARSGPWQRVPTTP